MHMLMTEIDHVALELALMIALLGDFQCIVSVFIGSVWIDPGRDLNNLSVCYTLDAWSVLAVYAYSHIGCRNHARYTNSSL